MNRKAITITTIYSLLLLCCAAKAQEVKRAEEPEYLSVYFFLDPANGSLVPLERQTAVTKIKVKAMGFGGGEGKIEINGDKSPTRFKANQKLEFVVRVGSTQVDPLSIVQFIAWKSKKGKRSLVITKVGAMGMGGASTNLDAGAVAFNATKYGEASFKITPAQSLPPGEYALGVGSTQTAFCFGIDPE